MQRGKKSRKSSQNSIVPAEKVIQMHILQWLNINNFFHWRQNNLAVKGRAFIGMKGIPDIIVIYPPIGKFIAIECKKKGSKQTADQEIFQMRLEAAGGLYILAYEVEDVIKAFKELMPK